MDAQNLQHANNKEFSPAEQEIYLKLLFTVLGDKPDPTDEEEGWEVSGFALPNQVVWTYSWGVDGMNYCSETEYSYGATLTVSDADPVREGYAPFTGEIPLMERPAKGLLAEILSEHSASAWIKDNGFHWDSRYPDIYYTTDVEFLFENPYQLGKNVRLSCTGREFR